MHVSFPFLVFAICENNKNKFQDYSLSKSKTGLGMVARTNLGELCWEEKKKISEIVLGNIGGF